MDTTKAFDMVDHPNLLCSLYQQGIENQLWHLYNSAYENIKSVVKWQGHISSEFEEKQGIRQGGLTSADAFICKADPLLKKLTEHPDGLHIGSIPIGAVMVADDLSLLSSTSHGLQSLINLAEQDASEQNTF